MVVDWSHLSAPQAAVLAAAIGIISAVIGQFAGAVLNAFVSSRQAAKNREMETTNMRQQFESDRERRVGELRRESYVEFQTAAHDLHSLTVGHTRPTTEQASAAVSRLQAALTRIQLVTDSDAVIRAVQTVKSALELEVAGQPSNYAVEMNGSIAAMKADLASQFLVR